MIGTIKLELLELLLLLLLLVVVVVVVVDDGGGWWCFRCCFNAKEESNQATENIPQF